MPSTPHPSRTTQAEAAHARYCADGDGRSAARGAVSSSLRFHGMLFDEHETGRSLEEREPTFFADLNLDQVAACMLAGREQYRLAPFFYSPLRDVAAVRHRHEVFRDLERRPLLESVEAFSQAMRTMREHLALIEKLHDPYQKERWFLDAAAIYCEAVRSLAAQLTRLDAKSRAFRGLCDYLAGYIQSGAFASLAAETADVTSALGEVHYSVRLRGTRVTVGKYEGEPDYSDEVEKTFAKFKQGAVKDYRVRFSSWPEMNHVEARILDLVARLYPSVFEKLDRFYARHQAYLDETVGAFDREIQFYLAYLKLIEPLKADGLSFCYPRVSVQSKEIHAVEAFDLALADKLVREHSPVVCNDVSLKGPERIVVVSGPNQGGKTTFARMFGQLHYLASLGCPVPGKEARLFLPDRLFTHFEREEDIRTLTGKLEDELIRVRDILQQATSDSIVVMNESFTSTTLNDALFLGTEVIKQIVELGLLCVYVTFVDELASLSPATVSMVSTVAADNPALRTYKIVRKPADGLAYSAAIAEQYGLTYESVKRRIVR
jgi:DNA mismatch repair protein MutS